MISVSLTPFDVFEERERRLLVVRYRVYRDGRWHKNGFWTFPLPVHEVDLFERAYLQFEADTVYLQCEMFIFSDAGLFY